MGEFFNPWRRKLGLLTLLVACVLMSGWVRSLRTVNNTVIRFGGHSLIQLISRDQTLAVRRIKSKLRVKELSVDRVLLIGFQAPRGNSTGNLAINVDPPTRAAEGSPFHWIIKSYGFEIGDCSDQQFPLQIFVARVPYWSIVIPLTLLSAYLLISKPANRLRRKAMNLLQPRGRESWANFSTVGEGSLAW